MSAANSIPRTFWRTQLNTTYTAADGLVIWSMAGRIHRLELVGTVVA